MLGGEGEWKGTDVILGQCGNGEAGAMEIQGNIAMGRAWKLTGFGGRMGRAWVILEGMGNGKRGDINGEWAHGGWVGSIAEKTEVMGKN
ncbi:unnamed protein product [Calypogeia fissa]